MKKLLVGGNKSNSITRDELERRQRTVEKLQTQHYLLNKDFNSLAGHTTIASSIIRPTSSSLWDDLDESAPSSSARNPHQHDPAAHQLQRDEIIRSQNEGLENLSKILSRNKSLALKISEEVTEQDEILDDIAVQMENTDGRINNGTQEIEGFMQKDSSMALWMIILALFIAILVVWLI